MATVLENCKIEKSDLSITSMHDHTLCDLRDLNVYFKARFDNVHSEMVAFKLENFALLKTVMILLSNDHSLKDDVQYMLG